MVPKCAISLSFQTLPTDPFGLVIMYVSTCYNNNNNQLPTTLHILCFFNYTTAQHTTTPPPPPPVPQTLQVVLFYKIVTFLYEKVNNYLCTFVAFVILVKQGPRLFFCHLRG